MKSEETWWSGSRDVVARTDAGDVSQSDHKLQIESRASCGSNPFSCGIPAFRGVSRGRCWKIGTEELDDE
jgi:hypothetical protein